MKNNICIEDGGFSWNRRGVLFKDINILIRKGEITSLCGPSGSGKSTIAQILQRKYELHKGRLLIDGSSVTDIDLYRYRKSVAVVPQTIKIFNGTILDNILVGREIKDLKFATERISELGLYDFYDKYEHGLMTLLGEEGIELSGGEKQILSLTRALLYNPEVLIIDEGLSGLDIDLENLIIRILKNFSRFHAVVLITHQIYSILQSDYVYVLTDGGISEEGKPGDLMNQDGYLKGYFDRKREIYSTVPD